MTNRIIAEMLFDYAGFLEARRASVYRIRAYRRAAETILSLDRSVEKILEVNGRAGLAALPWIGRRLSLTIEDLVETGEFRTVDGRRRSFARSRESGAFREGPPESASSPYTGQGVLIPDA
jgi:DNA polymerase/3'-5' exonuclease PolX